MNGTEHEYAERIGKAAQAGRFSVAAAESVTAGRVATALAAAGSASEWFRGSLVAYHTEVKQGVLGITSDEVITAECASEMATGVRRLTGADLAVAVTGVGGPDPEEDRVPGTVFIAVAGPDGVQVREFAIGGDEPADIVEGASEAALRFLAESADVHPRPVP